MASTYLRSQINSWLQTTIAPNGYEIRAYSVAPSSGGTGGTEIGTSGTGYSRKTLTTAQMVANGDGNLANTVEVSWTPVTDWGGSVAAIGIFAAGTSNMLDRILYSPAVNITAGKPVRIAVGTLVLAVPVT